MIYLSTVVSRIYAPRFATLVLVENVGGAYMRDLTFYLANTPPLPIEAADLPSLLILSSPEPQKLDGQDRLTEVGYSVDSGVFQAVRRSVFSICCCSLTPHANTLAIDGEFLSCSMDAGFVLALPRGP